VFSVGGAMNAPLRNTSMPSVSQLASSSVRVFAGGPF